VKWGFNVSLAGGMLSAMYRTIFLSLCIAMATISLAELPRFFRRFRLIVDISDSVSVRFLFAKQGILSDMGILQQLRCLRS
jgi:hypothetical protein